MINFGNVPAGSVLPIFFSSYGKTNGESITITGLAITDIEIYKGTSMTQRSSDAGYVLLDTDGIDIDGITGIHGFSIDLGDDSDAGFYAVGSFFYVVVSAVTVDGQTVNFIAATFRIVQAETTAGRVEARAASIANGAIANATFGADVGSTAIATNIIGIAAKKGVVDALNVDTYAEPGQEAPPATTTFVKKVGYLYKAWRNKKSKTAAGSSLYADDAATVDQKTTDSDDGTTGIRGEQATGP
jgi:hypothetical protein